MKDITRRTALAAIPAAAVTLSTPLRAQPSDPHMAWNRERQTLKAAYEAAEARSNAIENAWPEWVRNPSVRFGDVSLFYYLKFLF